MLLNVIFMFACMYRSPTCVVVPAPPPYSIPTTQNFSKLILPPVLVWDPYVSGLVRSKKCVVCHENIERQGWKIGQSPAFEPRVLHAIDSVVVLVSSVYVCSNRHTYVTTDPRVLKLISPECIPFILLHKTGFLKNFVDKVIGLVKEGMCISAIERFIASQRKITETSLFSQLSALSFPSLAECNHILSLVINPRPSNDILNKCFLAEFFLSEGKYNHAMSQLVAKDVISLDHTFKVAANIGYLRSDGKWVTQYNSVMIILNESGLVLGWQFTKTTSLDEVKDLFLNVRGRIVDLSKIVIIVDNCCNVRGKLSEIFGPDITVKLDLFHAVQRLTRKLPKKHPMIHLCTNDFRLVFRSPADLGHTRMNSTADSDTILLNMDQFVMKWKECEKMLNVPAMKEIESLKVHVKKGCLSGLPIGAGTNKNERLHRHLRPHFSHTRLGLPMALSCMTIILHQYNEKKLGAASPAVSHCQYEDDENQFRFGIPDKECRHNLWGSNKCGDYSHSSIIKTLEDSHQTSTVQLASCVAEVITLEEVMKILQNSLHLCTLAKSISSKPALLSYQFFPFMSAVNTLFFSDMTATTCLSRLDDLIHSWKMERHQVNKDGDSCFVSVAIGLNGLHVGTLALDSILPHYKLDCIQTLSKQLRLAAVSEWKNNPELYSVYADEDIESQADAFKEEGFFSSSLSDCCLTALANAVGIQFIVFTAQESCPVVHIPPQEIKCAEPVYLAVSNCSCGVHYDAVRAEFASLPLVTTEDNSTKFCTCGKNVKSPEAETPHCVPIASKYATTIRCWCLRNKKMCTSQCRCRNCDNEYGTKPHDLEPSRKRQRHSHQISAGKSVLFGAGLGEEMNSGSRSILEFFVLEGVYDFIKKSEELQESMLCLIYNAIADIVSSFDEKLPIGTKSAEDVDKFLKEHDHNLAAFTTLCKMQLHTSASAAFALS